MEGEGFVFVLQNKNSFLNKYGFIDYREGVEPKLGIGAMMLVDYANSPVGPYQELLFVPALMSFKGNGKSVSRFSVSKIYVSSQASVDNGINNWGIPKELAEFEKKVDSQRTTVRVKIGDVSIAEFELSNGSFSFPISTSIFPLKLAQLLDGNLLLTTSAAKGKGRLAKVLKAKINEKYFPPILKNQILFGMKIENFQMTFLQPKVLHNYYS